MCIRCSFAARIYRRTLSGQVETGAFEFRDPALERSAGLTPADRKWMDDIVRDVNEGWEEGQKAGGEAIQ